MNAQHKTIGWYRAGIGGLEACIVDPRIIFGIALKAAATAIILAHNHPSGQLKASRQDIEITRKLTEGGELLDINIIDHIILGEDGEYLSFADEGMMNS